MDHEDDGPDFSYAFGSAAWNPALRPNDESTSTLMPVERQTHFPQILDESTVSPTEPDDLPVEASYLTESTTYEAKQALFDGVPPSDDDFFDRYGSQVDEATSGMISFEGSSNKQLDADVLGDTSSDFPGNHAIQGEDATQEKLGRSTTQELPLYEQVETSGAFNDLHTPDEDQYEFQSNHTLLEEAQREDSMIPLLEDSESTALDAENDKASFFDNRTQSPLPEPFDGVVDTTAESLHGEQVASQVEETEQISEVQQPEPGFSWGAEGEDDFDLEGKNRLHATTAQDGNHNAIDPSTAVSEAPDLDAAWGAAFDDEDFLPEGEAADVFGFGDDDEGFLGESPETAVASEQVAIAVTPGANVAESTSPAASRYAPAAMVTAAAAVNSIDRRASQYLPQATPFQDLSGSHQSTLVGTVQAASPYQAAFGQPAQRPAMPNAAQSFADKARTGYASPYDLPEDITAKPRRRAPQPNGSLPGTAQVQPPPRSSSYTQGPISITGPPTAPPGLSPAASTASRPSTAGRATMPAGSAQMGNQVVRKSSMEFFAELPVAPPKPRAQTPAGRYGPVPQNAPQPNHPPTPALARTSSTQPPAPPVNRMEPSPSTQMFPHGGVHGITAVQQQQTQQTPPPVIPPPASRYSPATTKPTMSSPHQTSISHSTSVAAPPPSRYSPAPTSQGLSQSAVPQIPSSGASPPMRTTAQAYAPRTSSPLAYSSVPQHPQVHSLQTTHDRHLADAQGYPFTGELGQQVNVTAMDAQPGTGLQNAEATYTSPQRAVNPSARGSQEVTPPGSATSDSSMKRSNYMPSAQVSSRTSAEFAGTPPPRSTFSATNFPAKHPTKSGNLPTQRNGPIYAPETNMQTQLQPQQQPQQTIKSLDPRAHAIHAPSARTSITSGAEYIAPQDQRAADPLERWKGVPIFHWGSGGIVVSSFPTLTPRYGMGSTRPMIKSMQDEIKTRNIKDVMPTAETLLKFPGPLKKGKKKDVLTWLRFHTAFLEQKLGSSGMLGEYQAADVRKEEKLALWRLMAVFIENDGLLEGNPSVHAAVQEILAKPKSTELVTNNEGDINADTAHSLSEAFDPKTVRSIQGLLTEGNREKAVWQAVDQRLWAHGLLIASTMSKDVWKQVVQEFVRKEIRKAGDGTEPLAALYQVFAGNWDESIDELVSVSARAGFQMVSTEGAAPKDALAGLQQWRETLLLILNNRSNGDVQALLSLARLLRTYGRIEAAHICTLFALSVAQVGGDDNAQADITLVGELSGSTGSDFGSDLESILLTEVLEFGMTLNNPSAPPMPHLQAYKLYHAEVLAESGQKSEAQSYVDVVASNVHAKANRSPYYNVFLMQRLDDLTKRLSQTSINNSSSWKPSMDKVSSSFLSKFNSFVAGADENKDASQMNGTPPPSEGENFIRMKGDTPDLSRQTSNSDLYSAINGALPPVPPIASNSRYAPASNYTPRSSLDQQRSSPYQPRASLESTRSQYEPLTSSNLARTASPPSRVASYDPSYTPQGQYAPLDQNLTIKSQPISLISSGGEPSAVPLYGGYDPSQFASDTAPQSMPNEAHAPSPAIAGQPVAHTFEDSNFSPDPRPTARTQASTFDAPTFQSYEAPVQDIPQQDDSAAGYEPPSYQPYEPEPYNEPPEPELASSDDKKPKKKSFMDDDDDDDMLQRAAALKKTQKSEADRVADEAFRKAAEADAAKGASSADKRGSWFGGWFKGNKDLAAAHQSGPIKAKLGEENSFVYDPELKKWINKKPGAAAATPTASATPPPPKSVANRSVSAAAAPPRPLSSMGPPPLPATVNGGPPPAAARPMSVPPPMVRSDSPAASATSTGPAAAPSPGPPSGPPSRPPTSMSGASDLDDLLAGPITGRRAASGGAKRKGRYLDPMAAKS